MSRIITLVTSILFAFSVTVQAQHDLGTIFLSDTWVSSFNNPAWVPEKRIHIGLPTFYFNTSFSEHNLKSFVDFNQDPPTLNLEEVVDQVGDEVFVGTDITTTPLYFSIAFQNFRVGIEYNLAFKSNLTVPGDLVRFAAYGNGPYLDETLELGAELYSYSYQQISFPFSFQKGRWTFGIRPALLKGIASVKTSRHQLSLYTDPEFYQITLDGNYLIETSSILEVDAENNIGATFNEDFLNNSFSWKGNSGVSLDLGVRFRPIENLSLGAGITGIGQITWDQNVRAFSSSGVATYDGIDFNGIIDGDSLNVDDELDEITETFQLDSKSQAAFKTSVAKNFLIMGQYKINHFLSAGGIVYGELLDKKFDPAFAISGQVKAGRILTFGLSYGMRYKKWTHLGVQILVQFGPVQLFANTDNFLAVFDPLANSTTNGRIGLSVAFGNRIKPLLDD